MLTVDKLRWDADFAHAMNNSESSYYTIFRKQDPQKKRPAYIYNLKKVEIMTPVAVHLQADELEATMQGLGIDKEW